MFSFFYRYEMVGRQRVCSRLEDLTNEMQFSSELSSLVILYDMLAPHQAMHRWAEDLRFEHMLFESEFSSKISEVS